MLGLNGGSILGESCICVDVQVGILGVSSKGSELLVSKLSNLGHFCICIGGNELFNDHVSTSYSDNQLSVQDLGINLLGSKQIETISKFPDRNWAVGLVHVVTQHLIKNITLWSNVDWSSVLFIKNSFVHNFNDSILVPDECLELFNLVDLLSNTLAEVIESINEVFLVDGESGNVLFVSLNVSLEVLDLLSLQLNLLIQVDLLLSDDVELLDLVVDDFGSFLESDVDLVDLGLDLCYLILSIQNHLV